MSPKRSLDFSPISESRRLQRASEEWAPETLNVSYVRYEEAAATKLVVAFRPVENRIFFGQRCMTICE